MMTTSKYVDRDGRRIAAYLSGESSGSRPVVFCHGAPGSGLLDPDPEQTASRCVTLIGVDRPGYGKSDPVPPGAWATVASAADDLAAVLEELSVGPAGVVGWSAGGRVALALAARRPDLVDRVAVVATPAPHEQVPWIPPEHEQALEALRDLDAADAVAALAAQFEPMAATAADDTGVGLDMLGRTSADDAALAVPGVEQRLAEMLAAAFARGGAGMAADVAGYCLRPWGFEPADVRARTLLLYGSADPAAGSAHGRWWQRSLGDARLEMVPHAGHLVIVPMWHRILSHLAPAGT